MEFEHCEGCKRECAYIEVQKFIDYVNSESDVCYIHDACPDHDKAEYTCDLVFKDMKSEGLMYVEVKRVKFGFGRVGKSNPNLASSNGQLICAQVLMNAIGNLEDYDKIEFLEDSVVDVPLVQLSESEIPKFIQRVDSFLDELIIDNDRKEYRLEFSKTNKKISIYFRRKDDEIRQKYGNGTLYSLDTEEENSLESILMKMTDVKYLTELVLTNFHETSDKKFPQNEGQKILLNVLELPTGYEVFFNRYLDYVLSELTKLQTEKKIETAATEGYLLYYSDDFYTVRDNKLDKQYGEAMLIVPLIAGMIDKTVLYAENVIENDTSIEESLLG